jgi:hypothetical protein
MRNPIQIEEQNGVYLVSYFDKTAGWINRARITKNNSLCYRALTVRGELRHFENLELAKCFIISHYY